MSDATNGRYFGSVTPTPEDIARVTELPLTECPRRYCWWWRTLSFDWDTPVQQGCQMLDSPKRASYQHGDVPCCRSDSDSEIDHYEPREPHLEADGFYRYRFCGEQHILPDENQNDSQD